MRRIITLVIGTLFVVGLTSCATSKNVDEKIAAAQAETNQKINSVEGQVEDLQNKQKATDSRLDATNAKVDQISQEAQDALKRAQDAGLAAKKVALQETFTDDKVHFTTDSYTLSKDSQTALDDLASKIKALDQPYWVEIQGHTDDTGSRRYNDDLGERRADAVRRYLSRQASIPLMRMSTISYGDTLPVASNKTRKGRAQNRRVVVVVLE